MTQLQLDGYAQLVTPKLIAVMEHHVQLIQSKPLKEQKPADLN
jgi:hypothetical protein